MKCLQRYARFNKFMAKFIYCTALTGNAPLSHYLRHYSVGMEFIMKQFFVRLVQMIIGLFLYALGIVVTLNAHIGYTPWEVLHVGIANKVGLSLGTVSIITGLVIGIIVVILGEKIGLGTISNMILIGIFIDIILWLRIIPIANNMVIGIIMLIIGLFIISLGSYFYIGSAFGAGPRDSLMVALTRVTKLPIGVCRGIIEFSVALVGWLLGGMIGIGTVISVIAIGFCVQITFKAFKFDPTSVKHETLDYTYATLTGKRNNPETAHSKEEDTSDAQ